VRWGAVCNGEVISYAWPETDKSHINIKELRAAFLAFKTFGNTKSTALETVAIWVENCCALHAINQFGSARCLVLNDLASQLWHYAIGLNRYVKAFYIPGKENVEADWASRFFEDGSDWRLETSVFQRISYLFGPFNIDLFASHMNKQVAAFYSWLPDPESKAVDALSQVWPKKGAYAFPPFPLINQTLQRVRDQGLSLLLIAPDWAQQTWYPLLLQLLVDYPRTLPGLPHLLLNPRGQQHPLIHNQSLHLTAWPISGQKQEQIEFQQRLPNSLQLPFVPLHIDLTSIVGTGGNVGVTNSKSNP
jgi:hypothetical protein